METILITSLLRNNERYIPYMLKMFSSLEKNCDYNFKYLIYTNDNDDKTSELLRNSKLKNLNLVEENLEEEIMKMERVERLYHLREKLFHLTMKEDFDYLLMIDSDIFFNPKIFEKTIHQLNNTQFEAISTNTLSGKMYPFIFYYDHFSYVDKDGVTYFDKFFRNLKFMMIDTTFSEEVKEVKSSFSGFFLVKKETLLRKDLSYLEKVDKKKCEHINFNKNFKIGLATNINPLRLYGDESKSKYDSYMNTIMKNKSDNRDISKSGIYFCFFVIILLFIFILKNLKFKRYNSQSAK